MVFILASLMTPFLHANNTEDVKNEALNRNIEQLLFNAQKHMFTDSEKSQDAANKAYQLAKNSSNKEHSVRALLLLANIAKQKQQHYLVQKYLTETEALLSEISNIDLSMQVYALFSKVDQNLNKYESSLDYGKKYLALAQNSKNNQQLYLAYRQQAQTLQQMRRYHAALQSFILAETYVDQGDESLKFQALWDIVGIYGSLNDHITRITYIDKAVAVLKQRSNNKTLPKALIQLAKSQRQLNQYQEAIANAKQAIYIASEQKNNNMVAYASVILSRIYRRLGNYEDAVAYCKEAMNTYQALDDVNGFASAANALGLIYKHLDQNAEAIKYHQQVLELPANKIQPKYLGAALRELALQYFNIDKKDEALVLIKQSYEVYKKAKSIKGTASVLKIMGRFYQDKGNSEAALSAYNKAIDDSRFIEDVWNEAEVLILISVLMTEESPIEAQGFALKGLAIAKKIEAKWVIEQAYTALIKIETENGNQEAVLEYMALKAKIQADTDQAFDPQNVKRTRSLSRKTANN